MLDAVHRVEDRIRERARAVVGHLRINAPSSFGQLVVGPMLAWLGLVGAAMTYSFWLRGIVRLGPSVVAMMGMLSPVSAVVLGWIWLDQYLTASQFLGAALVLAAVWLGQARLTRGEGAGSKQK
ncbi:EamA family transporter [Tabrizicola sp.]|uniref:EamA family transporter n=1 Tax=Tabrizicola sp. TaxID=2005166 RepID=UPI0035B013B7